MPEIEIRPAVATDIPILIELDHNYVTDFVWQMELQHQDEGQIQVMASVKSGCRVRCALNTRARPDPCLSRTQRDGLLMSVLDEEIVGYASVRLNMAPLTTWVTDLAVKRRQRRQGIGSALVLAAQEWGLAHESRNLVIETQPKNHPAIRLAQNMIDVEGSVHVGSADYSTFFADSVDVTSLGLALGVNYRF